MTDQQSFSSIAKVMGSNPVQTKIFSGFNFTTVHEVVCMTAMTSHVLTSFSTLVQMYDLSHI